MAKFTGAGITINISPAAGGGTSPLKAAIQANSVNSGSAFSIPTWTPSTRLNYPEWTTRMHWDETNNRIVALQKRQSGNSGALHWYVDSTDTWEQKWAGYVQSSNLFGHPYDCWAVDPDTGDVWMWSWNGSVYKWQGISNTNANWALQFTPTTSTYTASSDPIGIGFIEDWYGSGQTGLISIKRSDSASGRFNSHKLDGTSPANFWTGAGITGNWYEPGCQRFPYHNGLLAIESNGHAKTGSPFENQDATTSVSLWIIKGTAAAPIVTRLPDPPSNKVSWNNSTTKGDKIVPYAQYLYLFKQTSNDVYVLDTSQGSPVWGSLGSGYPHPFNPGNLQNNMSLCAIPEYGGIVGLVGSSTTASENLAGTPAMYTYKIETVA